MKPVPSTRAPAGRCGVARRVGRAAAWLLGLATGLAVAGSSADGLRQTELLQARLQALAAETTDVEARRAAADAVATAKDLAEREVAAWSQARAACQRESVGLLGLRGLLARWVGSAQAAATQASIDSGGIEGAMKTLDEDIAHARRRYDADLAELRHRQACNDDVGYFMGHLECWTVLRPGASAGEQRLAGQVDDLAQSLMAMQRQRADLLAAEAQRERARAQAVEALERLNRPLAELDIALKIDARDVPDHQAAERWWRDLAAAASGVGEALQHPRRVLTPQTLDLAVQRLQALRDAAAERTFGAAPSGCANPPWWQAARFGGPMAEVEAAADDGPHRLGTAHQVTVVRGQQATAGRLRVALWLPAHDPQDLCSPGQARYATVWLQGIGQPLSVNHLGTDRPTFRTVELEVPAGPWTLTLQSGESDGCGWPDQRTPPPLLLYARTTP